jgi:hypothetical protein
MAAEQGVDRRRIGDARVDERGTFRNVVFETAAEVVEDDHVVPTGKQCVGNVGSDESGTSGDENLTHAVTLYAGSWLSRWLRICGAPPGLAQPSGIGLSGGGVSARRCAAFSE